MKKKIIASILTGALGALGVSAAFAANYYVVVPLPGKAAQLAGVSVGLSNYALPQASVGSPYAGFDFKSVLTVTGDAAYTGAGVSWSVVAGTLPAGLVLNPDGTLAGTPTEAGSSSFTLKATYRTKSGQSTYQVVSVGIAVTLATASLPPARVAATYAPYDFKTLLTVTGDPAYIASEVSFSATGVPAGMALSATGVLSGTPTESSSEVGFQVVASYKGHSEFQNYVLRVGELSGQRAFTSAGAYVWTVPPGVNTVSVVAVGGGDGAGNAPTSSGTSHFNNALFAFGSHGQTGGGYAGADGGGAGGAGGYTQAAWCADGYWTAVGGGGGAGGYTSNGGSGYTGVFTCYQLLPGSSGGGVGLYGGGEGGRGASGHYAPGQGGSGGQAGLTAVNYGYVALGGLFGGGSSGAHPAHGSGGGGLGYKNTISVTPGAQIPIKVGSGGAVRIIWPGNERKFPSTRTADE